jgi:hypothetical protein
LRQNIDKMTHEFPTLMISRRARDLGSEWNEPRSWFGGAPRLGQQEWPRGGPRRLPLYFLAQIDLAEVQREIGSSATLPDGALAFFISGGDKHDCAVVHVPRSESREPTAPPADALAVLETNGDIFPATFADTDPRLFPRWPVDITALEIEPPTLAENADDEEIREAEGQAQVDAVNRQFNRRQFFFKAYHAYEQIGGDVERRFWWHIAHHYFACLNTALRHLSYVQLRQRELELARTKLARLKPTSITGVLGVLGLRSNQPNEELKKAQDDVTRCETQLAEIEQRAAEFARFARDVASWVPATDPWEPMSPEAVETLRSTFERGKKEFPQFHRPHSFDDLETEMLVALATADDRAYATMPDAIRHLINTRYLLPSSGWHQMFGRGVDIQGNAAIDNEGNVMLLQLVYDDMVQWQFGDMGAFQFWIPPSDLDEGNWSAVRVTFECG